MAQPTPTPVSTGKRFNSVAALMKHQNEAESLVEKVDTLRRETRVVQRLILMRHAEGITQAQMGPRPWESPSGQCQS